jgi:hypothetical protein
MRLGLWEDNIRHALDAADVLLNSGCTPIVPHLTYFWAMVHPHPVEDWLRMDMELLEVCDCLLRLPGKSEGADQEIAAASRLGIPVFYNVTQVLTFKERDYDALHRPAQSGTA